ncbi:MAG: hypothetical protein AAFR33_14445, partial [Pseudomonadota bacterium]
AGTGQPIKTVGCLHRALTVNLIFSLRALAAPEMPQGRKIPRRHAAQSSAIRWPRSNSQPANLQVAGLCCLLTRPRQRQLCLL